MTKPRCSPIDLFDKAFIHGNIDPDEPVTFGDGTRFTAIPIMGTVSADECKPI